MSSGVDGRVCAYQKGGKVLEPMCSVLFTSGRVAAVSVPVRGMGCWCDPQSFVAGYREGVRSSRHQR